MKTENDGTENENVVMFRPNTYPPLLYRSIINLGKEKFSLLYLNITKKN